MWGFEMILAVVGMCGSGKSVVCARLDERKIPGIYFGRLTMQELKRRGLPVTPENERSLREQLRQEHGMAAFALLALPGLRALLGEHPVVHIDGLYSWDEYRVLEREFPGQVRLLAVATDKALRHRRLAARPERPFTAEQARDRDLSEIEFLAKGGPIAFADFTLANNDGVPDLIERLDSALAQMGVVP